MHSAAARNSIRPTAALETARARRSGACQTSRAIRADTTARPTAAMAAPTAITGATERLLRQPGYLARQQLKLLPASRALAPDQGDVAFGVIDVDGARHHVRE